MKRLWKIFVSVIAVIMATVACFSFTACTGEDIVQVEVKVQLYNSTEGEFYTDEEVTLTVDLYRHLAPKTCGAIINYINEGYYNDTFFYKVDGQTSQIMVGDYKMVDGEIELNAIKPTLDKAEFTYGGVKGSNLTNVKGAIGLWRSYFANDSSTYKTTSNAMYSGRATWYMPVTEIPSYDGYFCIFAQIDLENANNVTALNAIDGLLSNSNHYDEYVVYYTGTYDATQVNNDYGLTAHIVSADEFNENDPDIFVAEGQQLVSYNKRTIRVPNTAVDGNVKAMIKSITVK
ncbi:MAG: peptidylprolyl isomerase [Clostridia bacterium]|nr:peptidylprolyl isomerase [Clostridia bacterium]